MNPVRNQYLPALIRILLGGLFIYAAVPKILDPFNFAVAVYNYKMLPGFAVGLVAAALPWLELVIGILLVLGVRVQASSLICTGMLVVFTLAIFINTLRGIDVDCGCFSTDRSIGWAAVVEDSILTLLSIWCLLSVPTWLSLENLFRRRS
jgi:uncharacterized membrane protein YphA (DoxX/SURF4 family)